MDVLVSAREKMRAQDGETVGRTPPTYPHLAHGKSVSTQTARANGHAMEVHHDLPTAKEEVLVCSLRRTKYLVHSTWHSGSYITLSKDAMCFCSLTTRLAWP
jgi:hypothetical protein